MDLDVKHSNSSKLDSHCEICFPLDHDEVPSRGEYVDLLEFSNFKGSPYCLITSASEPRKFFADFRYTWSVPLVHDYPLVDKEVLASRRVQAAIANFGQSCEEKATQQQRGINFLTEIRANIKLIHKLLICPDEVKQLQIAENTGLPLVYLPLHRSHLDYLLITWCNWHFGLKLPHIASGDNLNLCGLGWLLRATGAFFIRRRIDPEDERGKDQLYRAVLHSYIEQVLTKNMPIEFFLEGTRSRFGKVLTPKNGLISNVVEAVQKGFIKDCFLVPVSYTYDAVVEGIFLHELMGIPKVRESVLGVFRGILEGFSKSKQCGVVRVNYGRPIRLSEYLSMITVSMSYHRSRPVRMTKIPTSFSYRELVPWHRTHSETVDDRAMIRAIGFHVVYEAQMMCCLSPVAVVSCLILAKWRKLAYNKNAVICRFSIKAVIAISITSRMFGNRPTLNVDQVIHDVLYLCDWLQFEFLFCRPCENLHDVIKDFISREDWAHVDQGWLASDGEHESIFEFGDYPKSITLRGRNSKCQETMKMFANLVRPFIQSLYIVCFYVTSPICPIELTSDSSLIRKICQVSLEGRLNLPFDPLLESINSDSFKNSLSVLKDKGLLNPTNPNHVARSSNPAIIDLMLKLERVLKE
ncbi:unnamed protein product [Caenorhabditis sp. 36 PRJEB53466]|nr:unnamed protein product [Caenorhabditis sp. 36 PRJEB53466]